jgi:hydroxymethylbilane synthase
MQTSVANQAFSLPTALRLGTRTSKLALWQTNHVVEQLKRHWPDLQYEVIHHVTQGDKRLDRPLPEIGGKGLFTAELEEALLAGEIDLAVHSLKDLPVEESGDLMIGAILSREDTRDVLVAREAWTLATLPHGAVVGTSSLRRQAQLLAARPDLIVRSIRGNVDTRIRKVLDGEYDAAVLAGAGITRLGLTRHITQWLEPELMLPAPGQGALAVQCRANDAGVRALLAPIHDAIAAATTTAERQLLLRLGGGCSAPIGAWAQSDGIQIDLRARIASTDGRQVFNASARGSDPVQVAEEAARSLLAQGAHVALNRLSSPAKLPLQGKRVVITRPTLQEGHDSGDFAARLQEVGANVLEIPAIQLVPSADSSALEVALSKLAVYDWVIFTSANGVNAFFLNPKATDEQMDWRSTRIAAVGPATQSALQARGYSVDAMPEQYIGSEIVTQLGDLSGKRVLLPRSAWGGRELPEALAERGATVDEVALYMPVELLLDAKAREELFAGVDVVTFASGSAVRAFANALRDEPHLANFWSGVTVACIGPTTAEVASNLGLPVHVVATEHTVAGLVAALVAYFEAEHHDA